MANRALVKLLSIVAVVLLLGAAAQADKGADKRAAGNTKLDNEKRLAACDRLLALDDLPKDERAWVLVRRGVVNRHLKKYDAALADFAQAEKLDPEYYLIYRYRGWVYYDTEKNAEAEAEFTKALKLSPKNVWSLYRRAKVRVKLKKYDDALKDYDKALELSPRYSSAYSGRAWVHARLKNYAKAIKDCNGAIEVSPYYAYAYHLRGRAYEKTGKFNEAIRDQAIAKLLDPNMRGPTGDLSVLVKKVTASGSTTKPAGFQQPKKGLSISYLMTAGPAPPKRDEMEEAIMGLAGFFKREALPMPKTKKFMVREITAGDGEKTTIKPSMKFPSYDKKKPPVASMDYYRALLPAALPMGRSGQVLTIEFDKPPLASIWPLKIGAKAEANGKYIFVGPDPLTPPAKFFGCKKPGDKIPFGTVKWSGEVVKTEKVIVPAGVFDTFVIRVEEEAEIIMMGRSKKRSSVITWWYAPSIRWWVKRTQEVDKNITVNEAETIK
ncbi:MAG: tetratricopeptide repeat protein [Phycisphaerae bacterium]|jgi:tetratricopeptide (TPR) repeat protein|nr:tetratricopeptide repeat protein [Phycisphaerae bacterium]